MGSQEIDRDKLRAAIRELADEYVFHMLDEAIDGLPDAKLGKLVRRYLDPSKLRPDGRERGNPAELRQAFDIIFGLHNDGPCTMPVSEGPPGPGIATCRLSPAEVPEAGILGLVAILSEGLVLPGDGMGTISDALAAAAHDPRRYTQRSVTAGPVAGDRRLFASSFCAKKLDNTPDTTRDSRPESAASPAHARIAALPGSNHETGTD